jgi:hypothetical protein
MTAIIMLLLLFLGPVSVSGGGPDLAAFFRSQSIPVTAVENREGVVVVKANFRLTDNPELEQLQTMLSVIFSRTAEAFPNSSRIRVDYSIENELVASLSVDTNTFLNSGGDVGGDSLLYSEMTVEASDRVLGFIHESGDAVEEETEDLVDLDTEKEKQQEREGESGISDQIGPVDDGLTAYVGAVFTRHDGEGIKLLGVLEDSPAANTGLQEGDIILEVEDVSFRDKGARPEVFIEEVQELPRDKPLRFHIEREGKRFDVWIKPLRVDEERLVAFHKEVQEKFGSDYSRGRRLMAEENYGGAIEYFQRSLNSNARVMESYQGLGICYYHLGKHKEARKSIENTLKLDKNQPLSWFYGALNMDALNRRNGAIDGYKRYLKLNHDNAEMNAFARARLEELRKNRRSDLGNQLLKIIDAIKKEIKK